MTDGDERRPRFRGLFIGINRYQSPYISNLASAVRDAAALSALFADNLGEEDCTLVTDTDATLERTRAELVSLRTASSEDDTVVIAFSGHGSDTHELITYDADPHNLPATSLALDEFTELVGNIPARHLVVVLDCCFSGGAGAKVLRAPLTPKGGHGGVPLSTEALLDQMAGTGRLILTASTADQPAWEDTRLGHGLLTYHLLQALLGPEGLAKDGCISFYDLLKYVTQRVVASASGVAQARQEPTLRGQWDGEVIWPVFAPGPRYGALYPSLIAAPVTADIRSLAEHGLSDEVLDAWATNLPGLNPLQQSAINEAGLLKGENVLVIAPTSSGKTMVGELAALSATQNGGRSVFLLPTKALVNEQYERFTRIYGPADVRVIRATGDIGDDVPALLRGQFDLGILTYEKFGNLALTFPHLLPLVSVVVIDEVQTIVDGSRGEYLELLLTLLKSRKEEGIEPQIVALSAVLGDLGGLDSWLEANLLRRDERPVPLDEGVLEANGSYRYVNTDGEEKIEQLIPPQYGESRARTLLVPLVRKLVADGQQVVVIRGTRGDARGAARYLAAELGLQPATQALERLPAGDPSLTSADLRQCLQGGTAFHISDLEREERRVVEEQFRLPDSQIRVIVATTTLAQGVNMPAETVIMPELSRRTGRNTYAWYRVAEYKNIAGRAGRLGLAEHGRAIVLTYGTANANEIWGRYVQGDPENVSSTLLDPSADSYTLVLRVVAIVSARVEGRALQSAEVVSVLSNSFAAHQARLSGTGNAFDPERTGQILQELCRVGFIDDVGNDELRLNSLGAIVAQSGLTVRSAIRVTNVLRSVRPEDLNHATLIAVAQLTQELDDTRLVVNTRGVRVELNTFISALHRQQVAPSVISAFSNDGDAVVTAARAKKAVACLLWTNGVAAAQLERTVMQHWRDRNAIGPVRAVVNRTHDVIGTIIGIATELHPVADLTNLSFLIPAQLELGIPAGLASLALAGAGLEREHYLRLTESGFTSAEVIDKTEDAQLLELLGGNIERLRALRNAVSEVLGRDAEPSLDDLLPDPTI
ncbi:putative helicase [Streptomyces scabiei 87.22]|uniref:Putative helicase n=1 Tax=Streptomyces scabiei (strain 87.22) TaxID=680198 RepID=C9Z8J7_STRSW|nr:MULTISPECIES: DEAD/DEAH box helicase [Streptomyces]MBP5867927.1 DEAD/DEAH box helicase [Streptomyces sp. LBUM 1485]MBP5916263.1 DEAD/DEAH box helicase [Streptomyces sp. LBUM 1486]MDX2540140.1 DEAD/DEAH box helicase [Streptomyces scabiei]MDX2802557.1 DEAD/DEAH box helicase [Streptomyces scabiei]MDX2856844.1 DEAD/DEAH box helicase [Streptomyces scabiei]